MEYNHEAFIDFLDRNSNDVSILQQIVQKFSA